jgi:hypothetical protein
MAFLNNNGDIILDAVLTDLGRQRLAAGDGSFRIVKFALSDDEIDYSLFSASAVTGQQDTTILSSPVFEAFTNNFSTMKSRLLTVARDDLKYLPIVKVNTIPSQGKSYSNSSYVNNGFAVAVDANTYTVLKDADGSGNEAASALTITLDQGYDNAATITLTNLPPDLAETQFLVEIDNRLGTLYNLSTALTYSYLDDDNIATYLVDETNGVEPINSTNNAYPSILSGVAYKRLKFKIVPTSILQSSDYLFDTIGITKTVDTNNFKVILANVTVTGLTTGYSVEIPVSFYKKV